jgi:hypothetical protein
LSRIWAGTGEDFCSREHRNQYRLRLGMDRLLEANKVANVMRRRETPRQIPAASLRSAGPSSARGYFDPQRRRENPMAGFDPPRARAALRAGLPASSDFLPPAAIVARKHPQEINSAPLAFAPQVPLGPAVGRRLRAHVAQAPASALPRQAAKATSEPRAMKPRWRSDSRRMPALPKRATSTLATNPLESAHPARRVMEAVQGRALRVSMASGFRIPEWKLRALTLAEPEITGMRWPEVRPLDAKAPGSTPAPAELAVPLTTPPLTIPPAPAADFERRFRWPGVIKIVVKNLDSTREQWSAFVPFGSPDESLAKERR